MNNSNNIISRNNSQQACAACKYQRRKCTPECIFAPYFPHDRQQQFLNAHKLFGVGKISNLIKPLDPVRRDIAMSTIIYESDMRANDPVGGCYAYIRRLRNQIDDYEAEYHLIHQRLAFLKQHQHHHLDIGDDTMMNVVDDPLTLYNNEDNNVVVDPSLSFYHSQLHEQVMHGGEIGDSSNNGGDHSDQYDQKPTFKNALLY